MAQTCHDYGNYQENRNIKLNTLINKVVNKVKWLKCWLKTHAPEINKLPKAEHPSKRFNFPKPSSFNFLAETGRRSPEKVTVFLLKN